MGRGRRDRGPRSEDDRERARLERERRRAARGERSGPESGPGPAPHDAAGDAWAAQAAAASFDPAPPHDAPSHAGEAWAAQAEAASFDPHPGRGDAPASAAADPAAAAPWWAQAPAPSAPADGPSPWEAPADPAPVAPGPAPAAPEPAPAAPEPAPSSAPATPPPGSGRPAASRRPSPAAPADRASAPPEPEAGAPAAGPASRPAVPRGAAGTPAAATAPRGGGRGPGAPDDAFDATFDPDEPPARPADRAPLRPAAAAVPPATVATRRPPRRRRGRRIALLVGLVPLAVLVVLAVLILQPFAGDGDEPVTVRIAEGSSVGDVGKALEERGVISNATFFTIRARLSGGGATIQSGNLRLRKNMSYAAALDALQQAPKAAPVISVSVPEGLSRRETAASVKGAGVSGDYVKASARSAGFDAHAYGQPKRESGLEGFLFPATYELPRAGATAKALVAKQLAAFRANIGKVDMRRARRAGMNRYEVLVIASMIEREVRIPSERRLVSAVIYNRLRKGMHLGIDATIRYAERNWSRPLKVSELERDGPYNTRTRAGLPPTPIGNPGLASIRAAANPAKASYLYYVVRPCGGGRHAFSSTDAQFAKDAAAYNAAQRRAGGDPSDPGSKACKR